MLPLPVSSAPGIAEVLTHSMLDRSWNHLTGKQLDCFTCVLAESPDDAAAPVSSLTGTSADGGVPPAAAMQQSDAAKQDLGDADDAGIGTHPFSPPAS